MWLPGLWLWCVTPVYLTYLLISPDPPPPQGPGKEFSKQVTRSSYLWKQLSRSSYLWKQVSRSSYLWKQESRSSYLWKRQKKKKKKVTKPRALKSFARTRPSKHTAGRHRPVRVADEPITARCRFIKNASRGRLIWDFAVSICTFGSAFVCILL